MDSGAYTEITHHGRHRYSPAQYASEIRRWSENGLLKAAVAQDWMCEEHATDETGLSIEEHQRRTIENYLSLKSQDTAGVYIMPVIQGREPRDYERHIANYGELFNDVHWAGIGSVCGRTDIGEIEEVIAAVRENVPSQIGLHGFGVKLDAFRSEFIRDQLVSADSNAWSLAARWEGRNQNDWKEGARFVEKINDRVGKEVCKVFYPDQEQKELWLAS